MWRPLTASLFCLAAAGCGTRGDKAVAQFNLTSSAFRNGGAIPVQFTCDGASQSPPLSWGEPPPGTRSFALVVDDPDAPRGTFRHWGAFDIPPTTRSIGAGQAAGSQAVNDSGKPGYTGPCPPKGSGPHHYHFKLYAVDVDRLAAGTNPKAIDVENEASNRAIAQGQLIGTYERK